MTLVPSANNTVSITGHILRGRAFIHIKDNRGPKIDPREVHISMYPGQRKYV